MILKLVEGVRWTIAARDERDERRKIEHLGAIVVSYLARDPLLPIYRVIRSN